MDVDEQLVIRGGRPLRGRVAASGSKNAALYTLAAALLTRDPVTVHNVPAIADIAEMSDVLRALGARVEATGTDLHIEAAELTGARASEEHVAALRASFLIMRPLLGRLGEVACPPPGWWLGDSVPPHPGSPSG